MLLRNTFARIFPLFLATIVALLFAQPAHAGTITVNTVLDEPPSSIGTPNGLCTLREAVWSANNDASAGDCAPGSGADTIVLPNPLTGGEVTNLNPEYVLEFPDASATGDRALTISSDVTIHAPTQTLVKRSTAIETPFFRLFNVTNSSDGEGNPIASTLRLENLTLENGHVEGSVIGQDPTDGGAIKVYGSRLVLINTLIQSNTASGRGGAISASSVGMPGSQSHSLIHAIDSRIENNQAGTGGGISIMAGSELILDRSSVSFNDAVGFEYIEGAMGTSNWNAGGGGIHVHSSEISINDSAIEKNSAYGYYNEEQPSSQLGGGGVHLYNSRAHVSNSRIINNSINGDYLAFGGGVFSWESDVLLDEQTYISGNESIRTDGRGGGLTAFDSTLNIFDSIFLANISQGNAGGLYLDDSSTHIENSTISHNVAIKQGGGVGALGGWLSINTSLLHGNQGENGGGIWQTSSNGLRIDDSTLVGNFTTGDPHNLDGLGGGIYAAGGTLTQINRTTIKENIAFNGGGIHSIGDLQVEASTISHNTANGDGGGIHTDYGQLINTTVSENYANENGGGIFGSTLSPYRLRILSSTIANNHGRYGAGIFAQNSTTPQVVLANSIVDQGQTSSPSAPNCYGDIGSDGYNLISNNVGCNFIATTGDIVGTPTNPISALLGTLTNNGGPTQTHALSPDSPAINAGDNTQCPTEDQRGFARTLSATDPCDIGSYEL